MPYLKPLTKPSCAKCRGAATVELYDDQNFRCARYCTSCGKRELRIWEQDLARKPAPK